MARSTTEDKDLLAVKSEEATELEKSDAEFESQINKSDKFFDNQAYKVKEWGDKQTELQKENLDFTIDTINQQKDQAKKDYTKEQSGAYVDWQKQSNQYGANAEKMAMGGMANSGYSESSQVSMYNAYQSRLTAARESYNRAVLNYDNAIKEARLQNSSILAEIAYETLQKQLELSLQGFQYKNTLILEKANARRQIQSLYQSKYKDVLNQINAENALEEEKRQFDATNEIQKAQLALQQAQFEWQKQQANTATITSTSSSSGSSGTKTSKGIGKANASINKTSANDRKAEIGKALASARINNFNAANDFMAKHGLSDGGQRLLTSQEWSKAKRDGQQGSEFEYNSYSAYLRGYLEWRIQES